MSWVQGLPSLQIAPPPTLLHWPALQESAVQALLSPQLLLHPPQWSRFCCMLAVFTHCPPPQSVKVVVSHEATQLPFWQAGVFPLHASLQAPQCAGSLAMSTQPPLQAVIPGGQARLQEPRLQISFDLQALPQAPQCCLFLPTSTQLPPQLVRPLGQPAVEQAPLTHEAPLGQTLLHSPQCAALLLVSTQPLPH